MGDLFQITTPLRIAVITRSSNNVQLPRTVLQVKGNCRKDHFGMNMLRALSPKHHGVCNLSELLEAY